MNSFSTDSQNLGRAPTLVSLPNNDLRIMGTSNTMSESLRSKSLPPLPRQQIPTIGFQ